MIKLQRVYDYDREKDGFSVLIDRLWPRGVLKKKLNADEWMKDVAPSPDLRKWFGHDPDKWEEFKNKYTNELDSKNALLDKILDWEKEHKKITLLYAAKDTKHTHALVLKSALEKLKKE